MGAVLVLAACGTAREEAPSSITVAQADRSTLDPALRRSPAAWAPAWSVYTPLITYRREFPKPIELVPALARQLPWVSTDGSTYRLRLRDGLTYSDGSEVRASDFEYAIKRVIWSRSPAARAYRRIVGATAYRRSGNALADIRGIRTDDASGMIEVRLRREVEGFAGALAAVYAAPVPSGTPFPRAGVKPPPSIGPYDVRELRRGRGFVLTRNPSFAELDLAGVSPASIDRIRVRTGISPSNQVRGALASRFDFVADPPPMKLLPVIREQASDRFRVLPAPPSSQVSPAASSPLTTLMSERMDFQQCADVHPILLNDPLGWCLKEGE